MTADHGPVHIKLRYTEWLTDGTEGDTGDLRCFGHLTDLGFACPGVGE